MDEASLVRSLRPPVTPPAACLIEDDGGFLTVTTPRGAGSARVVNTFSDATTARAIQGQWSRALHEVRVFQKWATCLDPSYGPVFDLFKTPPQGIDGGAVTAHRAEAHATFSALVMAHPGAMLEKFEAMGSPPILAYWCGARRTELSDLQYAVELGYEINGNRPTSSMRPADPRSKPVIELATGKRWASARELADELGCAHITVYNHMAGKQKTLQGRVFQYD